MLSMLLAVGCAASHAREPAPAKQVRVDAGASAARDAGADAGSYSPTPCANTETGADAPAGCVVLATGQALPTSIAVDATRVYWTNDGTSDSANYRNDGSLVAMPREGGDTVVLADQLVHPEALVLDAEYAYWLRARVDEGATGAVMRVALGGGKPEVVVESAPHADSVAVDDSDVYFFVKEPQPTSAGTSSGPQFALWRAPKDGSAQAMRILDGISGSPNTLLQAGGTLYWQSAGELWSFALDGGGNSPNHIARSAYSDLAGAFGLAIDHDRLYWTWFDGDCGIGATPIAGGDSLAIDMRHWSDGRCPILALAVNDTFVYGSEPTPAIWRSEKRPGTTTLLLATPGLFVSALAADNTALYAAMANAPGTGFIVRILQ
jgi:hypothetical protein